MDTSEIIVLVSGVLAIGGVLLYFFGPRSVATATSEDGVQVVDVTVKGGYAPSTISVMQGRPVRLRFFRDEESSCSEQVVLPDFGIARDLPAHRTTAVEFTPEAAGEYTFTCGMNMMRGKLIVTPAEERMRGAA